MKTEPCPFCGEDIPPDVVKCPACGEMLDDGPVPGAAPRSTAALIAIVLGVSAFVLVGFIAVVAAIAIPNLIEARKHGNEAAAIGALKTISTSQSLFREGDKDDNDVLDYAGDLQTLGQAQLIDMVLARGTKQGYTFTVANAPQTPEFLWMAIANPAVPGTTGDRYFVTNHEGIIYYSNTAPFSVTPDCSIPPGATPVGR